MKRTFLVILGITAFLVGGAIAQTADTPAAPHARKKRIAVFDFDYATVQTFRRRFSVPMWTLAGVSRTCWCGTSLRTAPTP